MLFENVRFFSIIAGVGLLATLFFLIGLIFLAVKKKPLKIWVWGLIISIIVMVVAYALAFSGILQLYKRTSEGTTSTNKQTTKTEITWEEAVELIGSCRVESVFQDHSRNVGLTLKDGTSRSTIEPEIDMVLEEAEIASNKCGFPIDMLTE